jgi:A/G-specific adenine glycosylase
MNLPRLRAAILRWYLANRRDLPWRRTRDPYAIWVSEIMLQQTRAETVVPYYERFLARFPTVRDLARGRERDVLARWSGLGYYSRARNLRAAAVRVVRAHGGTLPRDPEALRTLPGIGAYTAAAIASVAFDLPAAAVDGNVIRVLARIAGLRGRRNAPALRREVTRLAEALAEGPRPRDWTQALMELGATVCAPRAPRCAGCPVARRCAARASGEPDRYPEPAPTAAPHAERRVLLLARSREEVLLVPDADAGRTAWTLPQAVIARAGARAAARITARAHGLGVRAIRGPVATFRHRTFSHDLVFEVWSAGGPIAAATAGRWVRPSELERLPVRAPTLKALRHVQHGNRPPGGARK